MTPTDFERFFLSLMTDGAPHLCPSKMTRALRIRRSDLAGLCRISATQLRSSPHSARIQNHLRDILRVLHSAHEDQGALVTVAVRPTQAGQGVGTDANYRAIGWNDLQALALADGAQLGREDGRILLRFPWMPAPP